MKDFLTSLRKRENDNIKDFEEKHLIYMAAQVRFQKFIRPEGGGGGGDKGPFVFKIICVYGLSRRAYGLHQSIDSEVYINKH